MRTLELWEHKPLQVPEVELDEPDALAILDRFGKYVAVEFPTVLTGRNYVLTSGGYVGHLAVRDDLRVVIHPKIPVDNLFRMLEYAYDLESFRIFEGVTGTGSLPELFERLAGILARRVLARLGRGLYRDFIEEEDLLSVVRGRILTGESVQHTARGRVGLECRYEDHTADLEDNHILAWTLYLLRRSGIQREDIRRDVGRAYRGLAAAVEVRPVPALACRRRFYDRLNSDYRVPHALCRFFLEHLGPAHEQGGHEFLPFVVDMPRLFEAFVARWLGAHLPAHLKLDVQERAHLSLDRSVYFQVDLVIRDRESGVVLAVADTKYKAAETAENSRKSKTDDLAQAVAYAVRMGTDRAFLIYPEVVSGPERYVVDRVQVHSLGFDLGGDVEGTGGRLLTDLLTVVAIRREEHRP